MRNLIAAVALSACLGACSDTCRNTAISTKLAPTGAQKAVLFERDCGSTTGSSSQVSVTQSPAVITASGNAFVADTGHGNSKAAEWGGPWVEMRWLSPQRLLIRYDKAARVFTRADRVAGVSVSYEAVRR